MSDFDDDIYQEMILDHYKNPRNHCRMDCPTHQAHGNNPLCGDQMEVFLKIENGVIEAISFEGVGCAISKASGSLMTEALKGHSVKEAIQLFDKVHQMLTGKSAEEDITPDELGKLAALSGICDYPMRVKCASLAWHTLQAALSKEDTEVSTE